MPILTLPAGIRRAFLAAVVATLTIYYPEAAALLLAVLAARWAYGTAAGVWMLARVHPARYIAYGVLAVWLFVAIGGQPMELSYSTAGNMTTAAVAR